MPDAAEPAPRSAGAYAKGRARRQEILDRAIEVFARRGSDRTSLRSIAQAVGVTHAALSHYFGSLEELLVEVYRESERPDPEADHRKDGLAPVELMRASADDNRAVAGLVQLYSTLVASALEDGHPAATEFATTRFARVRADLSARVRRDQAAGRIRAGLDPETVASLVIAASDGLQTQWLLEPAVDQDGALTLLEDLLAPVPGETAAD